MSRTIAVGIVISIISCLGCEAPFVPATATVDARATARASTSAAALIQTQVAIQVAAVLTANAPTATPVPTDTQTPVPTNTPPPTPTAAPTDTPQPTDTPEPTQPPRPTSTPAPRIPTNTPTPSAEFVFDWHNPHYECQSNTPWTDRNGTTYRGYRSFQIEIRFRNSSLDKTLRPPWQPSRWVLADGKTTWVSTFFWQWVPASGQFFPQPTVSPGESASWTFLAFPLQQNEWVDHLEWDLFGRTYVSDRFDPGPFNNNYDWKLCPIPK